MRLYIMDPTLPGWAKFWRAYGARNAGKSGCALRGLKDRSQIGRGVLA
jgi:hypothetical protein